MMEAVIDGGVKAVLLGVVVYGVGVTFGGWLGAAAGAACWILMPYKVVE